MSFSLQWNESLVPLRSSCQAVAVYLTPGGGGGGVPAGGGGAVPAGGGGGALAEGTEGAGV